MAIEREFYDALRKRSRIKFQEIQLAGKLTQNYANILEILLRLRQACDHPLLTLNALRAKRHRIVAEADARAALTIKSAPVPMNPVPIVPAHDAAGSRDPFADIEELVAKFMAGGTAGGSAAFVEKVKQDLQAFVAARRLFYERRVWIWLLPPLTIGDWPMKTYFSSFLQFFYSFAEEQRMAVVPEQTENYRSVLCVWTSSISRSLHLAFILGAKSAFRRLWNGEWWQHFFFWGGGGAG